jgi:hypothetical protein
LLDGAEFSELAAKAMRDEVDETVRAEWSCV